MTSSDKRVHFDEIVHRVRYSNIEENESIDDNHDEHDSTVLRYVEDELSTTNLSENNDATFNESRDINSTYAHIFPNDVFVHST